MLSLYQLEPNPGHFHCCYSVACPCHFQFSHLPVLFGGTKAGCSLMSYDQRPCQMTQRCKSTPWHLSPEVCVKCSPYERTDYSMTSATGCQVVNVFFAGGHAQQQAQPAERLDVSASAVHAGPSAAPLVPSKSLEAVAVVPLLSAGLCQQPQPQHASSREPCPASQQQAATARGFGQRSSAMNRHQQQQAAALQSALAAQQQGQRQSNGSALQHDEQGLAADDEAGSSQHLPRARCPATAAPFTAPADENNSTLANAQHGQQVSHSMHLFFLHGVAFLLHSSIINARCQQQMLCTCCWCIRKLC